MTDAMNDAMTGQDVALRGPSVTRGLGSENHCRDAYGAQVTFFSANSKTVRSVTSERVNLDITKKSVTHNASSGTKRHGQEHG